MKINQKEWDGMTDAERHYYLFGHPVVITKKSGIKADSKVGDDPEKSSVVLYCASCREVMISSWTTDRNEATTEGRAFKDNLKLSIGRQKTVIPFLLDSIDNRVTDLEEAIARGAAHGEGIGELNDFKDHIIDQFGELI